MKIRRSLGLYETVNKMGEEVEAIALVKVRKDVECLALKHEDGTR